MCGVVLGLLKILVYKAYMEQGCRALSCLILVPSLILRAWDLLVGLSGCMEWGLKVNPV